MKKLIAPLAFALCLGPAMAEDPPAKPDVEQGFSLMEEGAKLLLRGLMSEMEPAMKDMEQALREMEPALKDLMEMVGDIRNYEAPEKLPNGDIIMRRKVPTDPPAAEGPAEGEIEL